MVLATSLPGPAYPAEQILAAYRPCWQIELAFKQLKSLLHVDRLRTRTQAGTPRKPAPAAGCTPT